MGKGGAVGILVVLAQVAGPGCGSSTSATGGAGQTGTGGQSSTGQGGGSGTGSLPSGYGWVSYPGAGYTVNAIWGDRSVSLWAVTMGGQLLLWDGVQWTFEFGGQMPALYSVWGLPGQTDIYFVGDGQQFYHLRGSTITDVGVGSSDNRAVWAARGDQVWLGMNVAVGGLSMSDVTTTLRSSTIEGPSDLAGVRAIWGATADDIWVIDNAGDLIHGVAGTWTRMSPIQDPRLTAVHGVSARDVWAVGPYALLHWNGGTWTEIDSGYNAGFVAVWASGPNEAWVAGDGGWIAHATLTTLQGTPSGTTRDLYTVWGTSRTDVWVGGLDGLLLHYEPTPGGGQPDAGQGCKARDEECGPGECCAPYNCRRTGRRCTWAVNSGARAISTCAWALYP